MQKLTNLVLAVASTLAATSTARADFTTDLAQEFRDKDYIRGAVVEHLMKLQVGKGCQEKILDYRTNQAMNKVGLTADALVQLAKQITGDDWKAMATTSANTPEENRKIVEGKIAAARSKLHITLTVDGSTCAVGQAGLWQNYLLYTAQALQKTPPKAGKAIVKVNASAKAKDFTVTAGKAGALEVTGPLDKEISGWSDKLEKHIARAAR
jgi:hypothetical protein